MVEELLARKAEIEALCKRYGVKRLDVFGSAARGDFDEKSSDYDFLVTFGDVPRSGFSDPYFKLLYALEELLGREVHLVEEPGQRERFLVEANRDRKSLYAA